MDSIGTINISVEKKVLNLCYRKKKVSLQDISLTPKQEQSWMENEEGSIGELAIVPTHTSDKVFEVQPKEEKAKEHEEMSKEGHTNE